MIKKEPLEKVATDYRVHNQDDKKNPLPPEQIVLQANERIGEKVDYNLLDYNCETVASEMRYGKGQGHSEQVSSGDSKSQRYIYSMLRNVQYRIK